MSAPSAATVTSIALGLIVAALPAAHLVGWCVVRCVGPDPRTGRRRVRGRMPGLPVPAGRSRRARRVDCVVARSLGSMTGEPIDARTLAARLGEGPEIVATALDELASHTPHELRVTRTGRLLYSFDPVWLARAVRRRRLTAPARGVLRALGFLAKLGGVWPLVGSLAVCAVSVTAVERGEVGLAVAVALGGVPAIAVGIHLAGAVLGYLLRPPRPGPPLRGVAADPAAPRVTSRRWLMTAGAAPLWFIAGLWVWVRALRRAVTRASATDADNVAPGDWVRSAARPDVLATLAPSHAMALEIVDALRRHLSRARPADGRLPQRVMARARRQAGRVSAPEIALDEGLDVEAATAVGARLCSAAGGEVRVSVGGSPDFLFPPDALEAAAGTTRRAALESLQRPGGQSLAEQGVVVNIPGLTLGHLHAAGRLAAGCLAMAVGSVVWVGAALPEQPIPWIWAVAVVGAGLMAVGGCSLAAAARYAAAAEARVGLLRDARRLTHAAVARAVTRPATIRPATIRPATIRPATIRPGALASERPLDTTAAAIHGQLSVCWPALPLSAVSAEVRDSATHLGLATDSDSPGALNGPLLQRLAAIDRGRMLSGRKSNRGPAGRGDRSEDSDDDSVVFDTGAGRVDA